MLLLTLINRFVKPESMRGTLPSSFSMTIYIALDKIECVSNVRNSLTTSAVSASDNDAFALRFAQLILLLQSTLLTKFPYCHLVY